jgi:hypothetical protein
MYNLIYNRVLTLVNAQYFFSRVLLLMFLLINYVHTTVLCYTREDKNIEHLQMTAHGYKLDCIHILTNLTF